MILKYKAGEEITMVEVSKFTYLEDYSMLMYEPKGGLGTIRIDNCNKASIKIYSDTGVAL